MAFESGNKVCRSVLAILLLCLPGHLSATCSTPQPPQYIPDLPFFSPDASQPQGLYEGVSHQTESRSDECKHGWCSEEGNCICNPCWSGPTCQEYVDRFAPRFLAEEPFFIVDVSPSSSNGYSTFLDHALDPIYPPFVDSSPSSDFVDPAPSTTPLPTNPLSNPSTLATQLQYSYQQQQNPSPLFRIESADDDLGLTCQLHVPGPGATCPCATPRYKVVGASTTFPTNLDPPFFDDQSIENSESSQIFSKQDSSSDGMGKNQSESNPFWADEETGDVFLQEGFKLQPRQHYFITLQVSALRVNSSGYKPWRDEVVATLYVRPARDDDSNVRSTKASSKPNGVKDIEPSNSDELGETDMYSSSRSEEAEDFSTQESSEGAMTRFKKTRLPYALRSQRPHYGFEGPIPYYREEGGGSTHDKDARRFTRKRKREIRLSNPTRFQKEFELNLSRLTPIEAKNMVSKDLGVIKMQLVILVPHINSVDFDVEILSTKEDPGFAILSAHVNSIGADITFDKKHTNLAPYLEPVNTQLHHRVLWHWRGVRVNSRRIAPNKNQGITVHFTIAPVAAYANASLLQLSPLPSSSSLSSSSNDVGSQQTNVTPLGKMTKDFNAYLFPIRARLSFTSDESESHSSRKGYTSITNNIAVNDRHKNVPIPGTHERMMQINQSGNQIRVELEGPKEIAQGAWQPYMVKVYLQQPCKFQLTIEQTEGNEIEDQGHVSVEYIRVVKVENNIASCTNFEGKDDFRVTCRKKRKGDSCTLESKLLNWCNSASHLITMDREQNDATHPIEVDEKTNAKGDDGEENVIHFESILYGLPDTVPDSQFTLRARVQACLSNSNSKLEAEATLSGRITKRPNDTTKKASKERDDFHLGKNHISIMPNDSPNGHGRNGMRMRRNRSPRGVSRNPTPQ